MIVHVKQLMVHANTKGKTDAEQVAHSGFIGASRLKAFQLAVAGNEGGKNGVEARETKNKAGRGFSLFFPTLFLF